jgi:hypothetical protein
MLLSARGQGPRAKGQESNIKLKVLSLKPFYFLLAVSYCLLLSACGFQPVYGTSSGLPAESPARDGIKVYATASGTTPSSVNTSIDSSASAAMSRQFVNNLEDLIGPSATPTYRLEVVLVQSSVGIGVARDGTASRYNLVISSTYKLSRIADDKLVDSGTISNVTSYNNPNNQYFSTYISEQDARKRGISELAELYRHRLFSFTQKTLPTILPPPPAPPAADEDCPKSC